MHWWSNKEILAGKDEEAGGTWLGTNREGKFGAITNLKENSAIKYDSSRGALVTDFLESNLYVLTSAPIFACNRDCLTNTSKVLSFPFGITLLYSGKRPSITLEINFIFPKVNLILFSLACIVSWSEVSAKREDSWNTVFLGKIKEEKSCALIIRRMFHD